MKNELPRSSESNDICNIIFILQISPLLHKWYKIKQNKQMHHSFILN